MAKNLSFNADAVKVDNNFNLADSTVTQSQTEAANAFQLNTLQATQAINTDFALSSNLLSYETIYKPPATAVFTAVATSPQTSVDHIDQLNGVLTLAVNALGILQDDLGKKETDESLYGKTRAFIAKYGTDPDVDALLGNEMSSPGQLKSFNALFDAKLAAPDDDDAAKLFHNGRILLKETQNVGSLHNKLLQLHRIKLKKLIALRDEKQQLATQIGENKRYLDALNKDRVESLGDYALIQRLVGEDWLHVEEQFKQRKAILEAYTGLYYVRVRETPVGIDLKDALPLRQFDGDDVVPGCPDVERELPDDLAPFMETVLDIPLVDWRGLRTHGHLLPGRLRQQQMLEQRSQRLDLKINRQRRNSSVRMLRLTPLLQVNVQLLSGFAARPVAQVGSVQQQLTLNYAALSLEDVLNGSRSLLSGKAQRLNQQLTQAGGCLLGLLEQIRPSIRFRWAQLVEDGQLPIEQPERWPELAELRTGDLNLARTLVELVDWFFRQLADLAADDSRTAMKQLISACLLLAATEDPDQLLYGTLQTLPGIFQAGEILRLNLNREALPGTSLQLLDVASRVVGSLRVDDQNEQGAVATVMQIDPGISTSINSFSVIGKTRYGRTVL
jgi:hypothetical protein